MFSKASISSLSTFPLQYLFAFDYTKLITFERYTPNSNTQSILILNQVRGLGLPKKLHKTKFAYKNNKLA